MEEEKEELILMNHIQNQVQEEVVQPIFVFLKEMMKKVWLLAMLGIILAGCGGESKYDSFFEAQQRRRTTKVFFDYEAQLKKDKETLAQLQEKEKSDDAKEAAKATERIKYLKMQIAHIEETILLRSLTDYESPEMTEKAVYVEPESVK